MRWFLKTPLKKRPKVKYPVTIIRHPKERVSKCSLNGVQEVIECTFLKASNKLEFDATGYIVLQIDAPVLSAADAGRPLVLLDSTWRLLPQLIACVQGSPIFRSLPPEIATAYPRVSKLYKDPQQGLASIEALYLALKILGTDEKRLLDNYFWKEQFLANVANGTNTQ